MPVRRLLPLLAALVIPTALRAQTASARDSLLVSPEWLAARLGSPELVILQVDRDSFAYIGGHIPGARLLRFQDVVVERDGLPSEIPGVAQLDSLLELAGVSNTSRVVIAGDWLPAARLFATLDYLGMGNRVALLDGGLAAWRSGDWPISTETPPVAPGRLTREPRPELVVDAGWIASRLGDPRLVLLDARPEAEFRGETAGAGVVRPGHIAGARSLFWRYTLTTPEPGLLKSGGDIAALLAERGATPGTEVVVYCRIGVQSSFLYFVARTAGLTPRLYDASFIDWNQRAELPVEAP